MMSYHLPVLRTITRQSGGRCVLTTLFVGGLIFAGMLVVFSRSLSRS